MSEYEDDESFMELYYRVNEMEKSLEKITGLLSLLCAERQGFNHPVMMKGSKIEKGYKVMDPDDFKIRTIDRVDGMGSLVCLHSGNKTLYVKPDDLVKVYGFPHP